MAGGWAGEETAAPGTQGLAAIGAFVTLKLQVAAAYRSSSGG